MRWRDLARGVERFLLPEACMACRGYLPTPGRFLCPECTIRLPVVAHPRCHRCQGPVQPGLVINSGAYQRETGGCPECRGWPTVLQGASQAAALDGPARSLVHALKYEGWQLAGQVMAKAMLSVLPRGIPWQAALLVPVPTSAERAHRRGYHQAAVLAQELARSTGLPTVDALLRTGEGGTQVALHPEERAANVRGVFDLVPSAPSKLAFRRVILVDDVLTTGATGAEVAGVLERAGVLEVWLLTFARTLPDRCLDGDGDLAVGNPGQATPFGFLQRRRRRLKRERVTREPRVAGFRPRSHSKEARAVGSRANIHAEHGGEGNGPTPSIPRVPGSFPMGPSSHKPSGPSGEGIH